MKPINNPSKFKKVPGNYDSLDIEIIAPESNYPEALYKNLQMISEGFYQTISE